MGAKGLVTISKEGLEQVKKYIKKYKKLRSKGEDNTYGNVGYPNHGGSDQMSSGKKKKVIRTSQGGYYEDKSEKQIKKEQLQSVKRDPYNERKDFEKTAGDTRVRPLLSSDIKKKKKKKLKKLVSKVVKATRKHQKKKKLSRVMKMPFRPVTGGEDSPQVLIDAEGKVKDTTTKRRIKRSDKILAKSKKKKDKRKLDI